MGNEVVAICGIAGIWHRERPVQAGDLTGMLNAMIHRGPDDEGRFTDRNMGFGMRRLAVIDVLHGKQPYFSEDGKIVAVYNGELYNYPELKTVVESMGHRLNSHADGEVLVHLYEEFGMKFLEHLSGMYAFALWDRKAHRLIIARDRIGQKPLYLYETADMLAFSSELKSFTYLNGFHFEVDPKMIPSYLGHRFVPAPHTLVKNVTKLRPGEVMVIHHDGRKQRWQYWTPAIKEPESMLQMTYWADRLHGLLVDVVRGHMASDVPLGVFLSGGLDSSILTAIQAGSLKRPVEAWSATFPAKYPGYDEFSWAEKVAQAYGVKLHRVNVDLAITPERVRELAYVLDEPMADPTVLPLDGVAKAAAEQETVMISGEGADEIFAGYAGYGEAQSMAWLRRVPFWARKFWVRNAWPGANAFRRAAEPISARYRGVGFTFSPEEQRGILKPEWAQPDRPGAVEEYWETHAHLPDLQVMQGFDVQWFLPDDVLLKADRIGMHHNLEIRVPFCDHEVVELALSLPLAFRRYGKNDKRVLREVAKRVLPADIVKRPKQGFPTPLTDLLAGPLHDIAWETLTGDTALTQEWFNLKAVHRLLADMGPGRGTTSRQIYSLLMLELWAEEMNAKVREAQQRGYSSSAFWS
ncbi:MAG: asparagine synthase (glutamine-hydrolyzing) [Firmicutes bacterium]|jgi:asparagine synthase (glutamine-hydrolysing)|uniref:asparagine synthase (glutamine-hydrolyzing) n=1 Tax=Sulfobacillus benefaciens TaxID=453960 RepID=A0A2T2X7H2_9FIRM|nr:asparagine synthase (glutamine-hydrolyzing) [Bacillota bacterium]PSR30453.1 MAG: asparagine synthase (glutamine-hydrolyzing) [Sulfobacillus benefaciens]